jgi:hypothetical protein
VLLLHEQPSLAWIPTEEECTNNTAYFP